MRKRVYSDKRQKINDAIVVPMEPTRSRRGRRLSVSTIEEDEDEVQVEERHTVPNALT